jgi:hypothetical protein
MQAAPPAVLLKDPNSHLSKMAKALEEHNDDNGSAPPAVLQSLGFPSSTAI